MPGTDVMLAHKWEESVDPTNWWMSEKLDGVRAFWTGSEFYSRQGNKFMVIVSVLGVCLCMLRAIFSIQKTRSYLLGPRVFQKSPAQNASGWRALVWTRALSPDNVNYQKNEDDKRK